MAPEFFNSNSYDGNQIDIWALGLLFHEILFGKHRFANHNTPDCLIMIPLNYC